jgi:hypothetical protein
MSTLHITNGDSAVRVMQAAGILGDFLPWRDVLHDGPVPAVLSLTELAPIRARFIAGSHSETEANILEDFQERDERLATFRDYDEVVLWFEHDLYDQLQLLQLLDWFAGEPPGDTRLSLLCRDEYLGMMSPERMLELFPEHEPVSEQQIDLAVHAWAAFRADEPLRWAGLLEEDTEALPFLQAAVLRLLEHYPSVETGLNRTEHQALEALVDGPRPPDALFEANQTADGVRFMGDWSFWQILDRLQYSDPPLLRTATTEPFRWTTTHPPDEVFRQQQLQITKAGRRVLAGEENWLDIQPPDRWIGGVHLRPDNLWRWDGQRRRILKTSA